MPEPTGCNKQELQAVVMFMLQKLQAGNDVNEAYFLRGDVRKELTKRIARTPSGRANKIAGAIPDSCVRQGYGDFLVLIESMKSRKEIDFHMVKRGLGQFVRYGEPPQNGLDLPLIDCIVEAIILKAAHTFFAEEAYSEQEIREDIKNSWSSQTSLTPQYVKRILERAETVGANLTLEGGATQRVYLVHGTLENSKGKRKSWMPTLEAKTMGKHRHALHFVNEPTPTKEPKPTKAKKGVVVEVKVPKKGRGKHDVQVTETARTAEATENGYQIKITIDVILKVTVGVLILGAIIVNALY